jgi:hypothetical protein
MVFSNRSGDVISHHAVVPGTGCPRARLKTARHSLIPFGNRITECGSVTHRVNGNDRPVSKHCLPQTQSRTQTVRKIREAME